MSAVDYCDDVDALRAWRADARAFAALHGGECEDPILLAAMPSSCFDGSDFNPHQRMQACSRRIAELRATEETSQ